jgi:hypothetical protein
MSNNTIKTLGAVAILYALILLTYVAYNSGTGRFVRWGNGFDDSLLDSKTGKLYSSDGEVVDLTKPR